MIVALEQDPYTSVLTKENPLRGVLECQAKYTPGELEPWLQRSRKRDDDGREMGKKLAELRGLGIKFLADGAGGGDKVNALPETVRGDLSTAASRCKTI